MPKRENLCVVIPVHKPELTKDEEISLKACKRQLQEYDCYLLFPEGMQVNAYISVFENLLLKPVCLKWLSSVEQYNKMKLSLSFYELFRRYKYMLTYELDAYIFNAHFEKANVFSYDFIGAPFFLGYLKALPDAPFIQGCNSGFSVRNIESCMQALQSLHKYQGYWNIYKRYLSKFPKVCFHLNRITKGKYDIFINGMLGFHFEGHHMNEDLVWTRIIPRLFRFFVVATPLSALKFSFEHNPERLFALNREELPLGCHAWSKYGSFWRKYITD